MSDSKPELLKYAPLATSMQSSYHPPLKPYLWLTILDYLPSKDYFTQLSLINKFFWSLIKTYGHLRTSITILCYDHNPKKKTLQIPNYLYLNQNSLSLLYRMLQLKHLKLYVYSNNVNAIENNYQVFNQALPKSIESLHLIWPTLCSKIEIITFMPFIIELNLDLQDFNFHVKNFKHIRKSFPNLVKLKMLFYDIISVEFNHNKLSQLTMLKGFKFYPKIILSSNVMNWIFYYLSINPNLEVLKFSGFLAENFVKVFSETITFAAYGLNSQNSANNLINFKNIKILSLKTLGFRNPNIESIITLLNIDFPLLVKLSIKCQLNIKKIFWKKSIDEILCSIKSLLGKSSMLKYLKLQCLSIFPNDFLHNLGDFIIEKSHTNSLEYFNNLPIKSLAQNDSEIITIKKFNDSKNQHIKEYELNLYILNQLLFKASKLRFIYLCLEKDIIIDMKKTIEHIQNIKEIAIENLNFENIIGYSLALNLKNFEKIVQVDSDESVYIVFKEIMKRSESIHSLKINAKQQDKISDIFHFFRNCPEKFLNLSEIYINFHKKKRTKDDLSTLMQIESLKSLTLKNFNQELSQSETKLSLNQNLLLISLSRCRILQDSFNSIAQSLSMCREIENIKLKHCKVIIDTKLNVNVLQETICMNMITLLSSLYEKTTLKTLSLDLTTAFFIDHELDNSSLSLIKSIITNNTFLKKFSVICPLGPKALLNYINFLLDFIHQNNYPEVIFNNKCYWFENMNYNHILGTMKIRSKNKVRIIPQIRMLTINIIKFFMFAGIIKKYPQALNDKKIDSIASIFFYDGDICLDKLLGFLNAFT
ncbi:hypothetical protein SteCoe_29415 [Stentor coeruleus]|uniref:F-box domain-containing protein n=1 Tax=Stentor coeruleus TaxID=5963 RepID=A0A1R2B5W6_9CILI|nr:hypothetical protein SteCoe_29415 [Stentor coeruleus]